MKEAIWNALEGSKLVAGRATVITGAGAGIGKACARLFAHQGARLVLADVEEEALARTSEEIRSSGGNVVEVRADVTDEADRVRILEVADRELGGLDILVNNAGGGLSTELSAITLEEWDRVLGLNLTSVFTLSQGAVDLLARDGGGAIVNLSSQAGRSSSPTAGAHYTASKAGVLGLTRHLASDLAKHNIRVNAICPGVTNSERLMHRLAETGRIDQAVETVPLRRLGDVDEIAACCLFLASDLASYVTGAALDANGGAFMG